MAPTESHIWGLEVETEALRAVVLLNGYPVFMPTDTGGRNAAYKLNPWIIEGDNVLRARLGRERDGLSLSPEAYFEMKAYHTVHGTLPTAADLIARYEWDPGEQEIAPDGVAIETLVGKCRGTLAAKDCDGLLALMSLYAAETSAALDVPMERAEQPLRDYLEPYFDDERWEMAPIDYGALPLLPVCGGRIVLVMAPGGGPVLRGQIRVDEGEEPPLPPVGMQLAVSNLGGTWTVVR